ncbi:leukocyte elastase inhibitor-like [Malaya genurostris]|uniref:leukocyte elastase inhibitor-like n=1 Tax=Malaya genurostris TaxID=325434 RepID=UPI0026F3F517|nr:leukocyte elastase inhibitor-like [Malaya genurostris]
MLSLTGVSTLLLIVAAIKAEDNEFNTGNLDFALKFFKNSHNQSSNSVVSPISVRLALAAIYQAAEPPLSQAIQEATGLSELRKQQTAEDITSFLQTTNNEQFHVHFKAYKKAEELDPKFETAIRTLSDSGIETVDFSDTENLSKSVNQWVSNATDQMIREMVQERTIDPATEFMLINTVALKAQWANRFPSDKIRRMPFHFINGDREVDMMQQVMTVPYRVTEHFHAAELLYSADSDLSMWLLLPRSRGQLPELIRMLSPEMIENIRLGSKTVSLNVEMPRFTIRNELDVRRVLQNMGHGRLFEQSDLQVFATRRSQFDDFFQSAIIAVDEAGTRAVAASRINVKWRIGPRPFLAHRPFLFFVQKRSTNTILFIGQYSNHED